MVCLRIRAAVRRGGILCAQLNSIVCALFSYACLDSKTSATQCKGDLLHLAHAQNVHANGSRRGGMFQCSFSTEWAGREATEWLDKGSWLLV